MISISVEVLYTIVAVNILLLHASLYLLFIKAGYKGWKAFVPGYNVFVVTKITGRPWYWILLMLLPVIGFLFVMITLFDLLHSFGRKKFIHFVLGMLFGVFYLFAVAVNKRVKYIGPRTLHTKQQPMIREWAEAIILAVVLVSVYIKPFWFETYNIPSQSMEGTLLMGDYILVSKFHYGPRLPITPLAIPFVHSNVGNGLSYYDGLKLPYLRLPGISHINRGDVVVFNYPADDTKPIDRRSNYIKRCVALPGDTFYIDNKLVKANKQAENLPVDAQLSYMATMDTTVLPEYFDNKGFGLASPTENLSFYEFKLTPTKALELAKLKHVDTVKLVSYPKPVHIKEVFPNSINYPWNVDYYGPLYVPKKGDTIILNDTNIVLYKRIIEVYEGNKLTVNGPYIKVNGIETQSYIIKQNYYFMMGDNRDYSSDSRYWGFVPEDHIVGKAWFIWLSINEEGSYRTERLFKQIK